MKVKITEAQLDFIIAEVLDERDGKTALISEALTKTDEDKVKAMVKKEVKDIIGAANTQQFEQMVTKMLKEKIKGDKQIEDHLLTINRNALIQLYKTLWMKRNFWVDSLSNNAN